MHSVWIFAQRKTEIHILDKQKFHKQQLDINEQSKMEIDLTKIENIIY